MNMRRRLIGPVAIATASLALHASAGAQERHNNTAAGLVQEVRLATAGFRQLEAATAAGYASTGSCVSGPERGAMGIHFANGPLIEDGVLDAKSPELALAAAGHH